MVVQRGLEPIFSLDRVLSAGGVLLSSRAGLFLRFLLAGVVFAPCAVGLRRLGPQTRAWAQVLVSLALIGTLATPGIATGMAAYALVLFWTVERAPLGRARAPVAILLLAVQLIAPIVWLPRIAAYVGTVREFVAFATNVTLLRSWGYVYDRLRRPEPEPPSLRDYALFMFFFPAFANGPLVSLDEFRRRRLPGYWDDGPGGARVLDLRALGRVATAVVALALALQLVSMFTSPAFETAASAGTLAAWRQAAACRRTSRRRTSRTAWRTSGGAGTSRSATGCAATCTCRSAARCRAGARGFAGRSGATRPRCSASWPRTT
jgi:hypothetical protein